MCSTLNWVRTGKEGDPGMVLIGHCRKSLGRQAGTPTTTRKTVSSWYEIEHGVLREDNQSPAGSWFVPNYHILVQNSEDYKNVTFEYARSL